jgi:hypothetical protein
MTDPQADLTQRAHVHETVKQLMHDGCWRCNYPTCVTGPVGSPSCWGRQGKLIARVIQSEREAARRAAIGEVTRWWAETRYENKTLENLLGAIASPAPQDSRDAQ